ncbi:MAG: hypothetical protein R3C03_07130 [Pirellulaceae bacterium]
MSWLKRTRLFSAGAFMLCVAVVVQAMAQPPQERGGPPGPGGPGMPPPNPLMEALDTDGDHQLSAEEIAAAATSLLALDRNGNGILDDDEVRPESPAFAQGPDGRRRGGPPADRGPDREGRPPQGDRAPGQRGGGPGQGNPPPPPNGPEGLVDHAFEFDADGDGLLSREELMEFARQMPPPPPPPEGPGENLRGRPDRGGPGGPPAGPGGSRGGGRRGE